MDQVLQDMENLDLDVTDETGAATASDGTDATASGEESSGTESQTQETPGGGCSDRCFYIYGTGAHRTGTDPLPE